MRILNLFVAILLLSSCTQKKSDDNDVWVLDNSPNPLSLDKTQVPEPVYDAEPGFVDFYWKAWELAWNHVKEAEGIPQSPYMDEAHWKQAIWIWDTGFMTHFCKYAPGTFPGIESLDNFYAPMHDNKEISLVVLIADNPPLFAWSEYEYYKLTGDKERLKRILVEKQYLQKHYEFFEKPATGKIFPYADRQIYLKDTPFGFKWKGSHSGMDNTPRGRENKDSMLWVDAISQQALSALYIKKIAIVLGEESIADEYTKKFEEKKALINKYYWNNDDGIYYDIESENPETQIKVKTPAAYWAMLAEVPDNNQAKLLEDNAENPDVFGGKYPWTTVSRNDIDFEAKGRYWRGGVWLPTAYMSIKALEKYGYYDVADQSSYDLLKNMYKTYMEFEPNTIWECYSPTEAKPSTLKKNVEIVRPDFCGWSALGPISLFIENVLGFHEINAAEKKVVWRKYREGRHGIKRLRFGTVVTDIIGDGNTVEVNSNEPYTLVVNGKEYSIEKGKTVFNLEK
jgi:glycogen debranching enzyme